MLLHLSMVHGCLSVSPTMAEQSDREIYHPQSLKYLLSGPVLKGRDHVPFFHVRQCLAQGTFQGEVLVLLQGPAGATIAPSTGKPPPATPQCFSSHFTLSLASASSQVKLVVFKSA